MNKSVWKRAAADIFSAAMLVTALTACGGSSNASAEADTQQDTAANTSSAETVTVAVPGTPKPYNYVDDNGKLGGKKVPAGAGRANAQFMESYNKGHADNPLPSSTPMRTLLQHALTCTTAVTMRASTTRPALPT